MKNNFKLILPVILFLIGVLALEPSVHAEITTITSAINKAGRQRMLTQRMLKYYAMIGIDVQREDSIKQLHDAVYLFNFQLGALNKFSPNTKIRKSIYEVEKIWSPYQKKLLEPISRQNAKWLLEKNNALLNVSQKVVVLLQDTSGSNYGKLVNISGRQRMLSQMLAKFYMLKAWGFDSVALRKQSEWAKNEFESALQALIDARENTNSINLALKDARSQWNLFKYGLERKSEKLVPLIVAMTSEKVLIKMNEITDMYENLSDK